MLVNNGNFSKEKNMFPYTTKMEINLRNSKTLPHDLNNLPIFMIKNRIPALVVPPELLELVAAERVVHNADYQIITMVDWEDGNHYAMDKLKLLTKMALQTDGLEIRLSHDRNDMECHNELSSILDFIKKFNPLMQVRWVFEFRKICYDSYKHFFKHMKKFPATFVRTSTIVELANNFDVVEHARDIERIKQEYAGQVKISGNITKKVMDDVKAARYDVTVDQAKSIIKEINELKKKEQLEAAKLFDMSKTPKQDQTQIQKQDSEIIDEKDDIKEPVSS